MAITLYKPSERGGLLLCETNNKNWYKRQLPPTPNEQQFNRHIQVLSLVHG